MKKILSILLVLVCSSGCASYHQGKGVNEYAVVQQKANNPHAAKWGVKITVK